MSNYSIDDSNGTLLVAGLSRDAAHRSAQQHASRTREIVRVYEEGGNEEWLVSPSEGEPADSPAVDPDVQRVTEAMAAYLAGDPDAFAPANANARHAPTCRSGRLFRSWRAT